ncbi:lytic transglycosylase domain-containing protein [Marinivivus vitaminiproducens]|uniref:lytic transglycosylase domain-containing protein n=1 Tax=Marinivivus vitaminiproducens TaxID=3035935 RepID=UPI0027A1BA5C|nr:lytic transglycosylase domain-containing protein [Geminicoccaceae bacterium SCSIO 64248]
MPVQSRLLCLALLAWVGFSYATWTSPARADEILASDPARILTPGDVARYQRIFVLQKAARWTEADHQIASLHDGLLLGHVLAQRYLHPTGYVSTYEELRAWLGRFADHPQAERIWRLALQKNPQAGDDLPSPVPGYLRGAGHQEPVGESKRVVYTPREPRDEEATRRVTAWQERLNTLLRDGDTDAALATLDEPEIRAVADPTELDLARWQIAHRLFVAGDDLAALRLANQASASAGRVEPRINWTAGLAAWRLGMADLAAGHFATLATAPGLAPAEAARAAFWAARAYAKAGDETQAKSYLKEASASPSAGFYGLLARVRRGQADALAVADSEDLVLTRQTLGLLLNEAGAKRAIALAQAGQSDPAEQEIRKLAPRARPELFRALVTLASELNLPAAQFRLAQYMTEAKGYKAVESLYPVPSWTGTGAIDDVDRALVLSVARAESGFDAKAKSPMGARGTMQLMPGTAWAMAEVEGVTLASAEDLDEPQISFQLGAAYLRHLTERPEIGDNFIYLAVGYNAGPGRLAEWREAIDAKDDPLLFIETLPNAESRAYAKKFLMNVYSYRLRLGQKTDILAKLVAGSWPRYTRLDRNEAVASARD